MLLCTLAVVTVPTSELLKEDFNKLLNSIMVHSRQVFINGPIPALNRGVGRFNHTLSFHTWLKFTCAVRNIVFIIVIYWQTSFGKRPAFFRPDGIYPNGFD